MSRCDLEFDRKTMVITLDKETDTITVPTKSAEGLNIEDVEEIRVFKMTDKFDVVDVTEYRDIEIKRLIFPEEVRFIKIGYLTFMPAGLEEIEFNGYIEGMEGTIRDTLFRESLRTVKAKGFLEIADFYFEGCVELREVITFGEYGIKDIKVGAFQNCNRLDIQKVINQGVQVIRNRAFDECNSFNGKLELPESVEMVGNEWIGEIRNLEVIDIKNDNITLVVVDEEVLNIQGHDYSSYLSVDEYESSELDEANLVTVRCSYNVCKEIIARIMYDIKSIYGLAMLELHGQKESNNE